MWLVNSFTRNYQLHCFHIKKETPVVENAQWGDCMSAWTLWLCFHVMISHPLTLVQWCGLIE